ncbi:hypothetical protein BBJ28_00009531 [Nothophytophthora sp. Chile5]|nr:hypothetical protein BBJ28_00009531 [Nothophytophthora sp. Chile5]
MGGFMRALSRSAVALGAATVAIGVAYGVHYWIQRRNHQERPRERSTQRRRAATRSSRRERQDVRLQARKLARGEALALQRAEMTEEQRREQRESIRMRRVEQYVRIERFARKNDLHEAPLERLYRPEELVYLSPDADDVLPELDPTCVYVVGGIVDRSVRKGETMAKATAQGLRTARLPLQEHFALTGEAVRTHILNLDSVLIVLNEVANHGDWGRAFQRAVPPRITRRRGDKKAKPLNCE